ncbi:fasciclin domain-containing protein [Cellulomonas alba]|uniref:Fasciclin domain-containing protein n=1 Tax=Cellulomonas alba TaxID=3053467 RepID=A0ABT7SFW1_9CELL|nr:fasciclin domain-containing protein [Cellulomonas alba]MDM7855082.1 fasciclin domain-containing protein [Cellulomonas alba]
MRTSTRTRITAVAVAGFASLGLAACSSNGSSTGSGASSPAMQDTPMSTPMSSPMSTPMSTDGSAMAAADLVGPGCAAYAAKVPTGAGSITGMSTDPVAVAASNNPMLTTLTAAVSGKLNPKVNLVSTLDGSEFTVFAPVDDAFAKIPAKTIDSLKTDDKTLTTILTYHVVPGQLSPSQVVGDHKTVEGGMVKVTGSGDDLMVNGAKVVCGGVHTANATVYLIDSVLMPAK